jgi:uncharacterized protein YdhG (YjbR/CyaY superfamily)
VALPELPPSTAAMNQKAAVPDTVDAYLASFPDDTRRLLEEVRAALRSAIPDAVDSISYAIPALKVAGRPVIYFAGARKHIGVYPAPTGDRSFEDAIAPHRSGRATLRFPLDQPIPVDLIERIGRAALQNHIERDDRRRATRRSRR